MSDSLRDKWIFVGNLIVPTEKSGGSTAAEGEEWLGDLIKLLRKHVLIVDEVGVINDIFPLLSEDQLFSYRGHPGLMILSPNEFLCPGFIDLHIHAPQFAFTGTATDRPLTGKDGWLERYTFPAEQKLGGDLVLAEKVYSAVVKTTLETGTTTALYFATLDLEPCKVLVDESLKQGQRSLVGKVCMDRNSPPNYCHSTQQNLDDTEALVQYIRDLTGQDEPLRSVLPLVLPVITPRFIPTCSPELLAGLGVLAKKHQCHITSHISESHDEVAWSRDMDANVDLADGVGRSDSVIFDSHGLLTDRCVMAHGVLVDEPDLDLLKKRGAAIACCPCSNFFFAGKSLECKKLMRRGNKVGLGTDVAGGYSPSMLDSCRMSVIASRALQHESISRSENGDHHSLDYRDAFYMGTLGGAIALGLEDQIGTLKVGLVFDAIVLSADVPSPVHIFDDDTTADIFQKLCVLGDDRNVKHVFVQGKQVKGE